MSEENKNLFGDNNNNESNAEAENAYASVDATGDTVYFSDSSSESQDNGENLPAEITKKKEKRRISIKAFVISLIAVAVAAVMLTYSICSALYQSMYAKAYVDANKNSYINGNVTSSGINELDVIAKIVNDNYYGELNSEELMNAAIEAYIKQTGDVYAAYYTQEELDAQLSEDVGNMVGIGVNIINSKVTYKDAEISVLKVINVVDDSPAEKNGVKVGDYIYAAIIDGKALTVNELGYDETLNKLLGEIGSTASFIVLRSNGEALEEVTFNIVREKIVSRSVYYRIPKLDTNVDNKIGVVKITNFDYTTPTQFSSAIDDLKSKGCEKFIFDVRYNPGGYQSSVGAVLSYFLNEGDVYIRTKNKSGEITSDTVKEITEFEGDYSGCNVSKADIGKYKDLDVVVLCNEYTASAGELFVATFKDYELGKVVGNTTFGKGKLQSTYYLKNYALFNYGATGIDGAVKITTHEYFSAKSDSYDGIGIEPNEKVALSEAALNCNIYDYDALDPIDDQLLKAINILNG